MTPSDESRLMSALRTFFQAVERERADSSLVNAIDAAQKQDELQVAYEAVEAGLGK